MLTVASQFFVLVERSFTSFRQTTVYKEHSSQPGLSLAAYLWVYENHKII